jgi:hypothetical protein
VQALQGVHADLDAAVAVGWWIAVLSVVALLVAGAVWLFVWYVTRD